jgi:hypothetical protein
MSVIINGYLGLTQAYLADIPNNIFGGSKALMNTASLIREVF